MFFRKRLKTNNINGDKDRFIIAGLGNPGNKYADTKHNVGFDTVDLLARKYSVNLNKIKFKAVYGEGKIGDSRVVFVKPQTFMNLSGESVSAVRSWYKIPEERIIIIFDDIDISLGEIRIKRNGSAGSHNGMKSIIYQLGKDNFPRVKIGIGPKPDGWDLADFVLSKFTPEDRKIVDKSIDNAAAAAEDIIKYNIETAMGKYN